MDIKEQVMEQRDAARDELLDDDDRLVENVKDVKEVEKRLRHKLLQHHSLRSLSCSCVSSGRSCINGMKRV